jgi:opacity protein-like surface antigen
MRILTLFFILIPLIGVSQNTHNSTENKFQFGFSLTPEISFNPNFNDSKSVQIINENNKIGYTTGISLLYNLNNHFTFETGIEYSIKKHSTTFKEYNLYPDGIPDPAFPKNEYYKLQYLDIPLIVNYKIFDQKPKIYLLSGIQPSVLFKETTTKDFYESDEKMVLTNSLTNFNLCLIAGTGVDFILNDKLSFRIELLYKHFLPSFNTDNRIIQDNLHSIGIKFGFYYYLN